jgi:hypothetical protein
MRLDASTAAPLARRLPSASGHPSVCSTSYTAAGASPHTLLQPQAFHFPRNSHFSACALRREHLVAASASLRSSGAGGPTPARAPPPGSCKAARLAPPRTAALSPAGRPCTPAPATPSCRRRGCVPRSRPRVQAKRIQSAGIQHRVQVSRDHVPNALVQPKRVNAAAVRHLIATAPRRRAAQLHPFGRVNPSARSACESHDRSHVLAKHAQLHLDTQLLRLAPIRKQAFHGVTRGASLAQNGPSPSDRYCERARNRL